MIEWKEQKERVILVGVSLGDTQDTELSLEELEELVDTAGAVTVGRVIQNRESQHAATYVGKGKVQEILELAAQTEADGIVCDDELTPVQMKNLEDVLGLKIMDRTLVSLDIFAARASTSEGKLQVELAQLKYRQARLAGLGREMSRLGGGIGTRGPGEKKLETDRRRMRARIAQLGREIREVQRHREVTRTARKRSDMQVAAIVGYTNAGKSTLLNTLTGAHVLEEDKLFATLDPTTRCLELPGGQKLLLTDTVGFIRKLPHHLIEAFKSTLEEAKYADYILHVVDAAAPEMELRMHVVYETLKELGVRDKKILTLFNKSDLREGGEILRDFQADRTLSVSARTGQGLEELKAELEKMLRGEKVYLEHTYPYSEAGLLALIRREGELLEESYRPEGIRVRAFVPRALLGRLEAR